ncbi:MAG: DUF6318 family protein [Motilibacteraceae bacterium]
MGAIAALALAPLALTGCTGASSSAAAGPTPAASTASPAPTPRETPKPTPPAIPDAAESADEQGAKAFAAYFWQVVNYVGRTRDTVPLQKISSADCKSCNQTIDTATKARAKGESVIGAVVDVRATEIIQRGPVWKVEVGMSRSSGVSVDSQGTPIATTKAVPILVVDMTMERRDGEWVATSVTLVSSS